MSRSIFKDIKTFAKNIGRHARYVFGRKESVRDAVSGLTSDARKLGKHVGDQHASQRRKAAMKLIKQGRQAYNAKNDTAAERFFRDAVMTDETCALAYAYLGNALYRQGRTDEAEHNWRHATMVEPASEGADKAFHSLQRLAQKKKQYADHLDNRLKNGPRS